MTTFRTILALAAGVAVTAGTTAADSIALKRSVRRVATDRPVLLGDIATIDGDHAATFAALEIASADSLPVDGVSSIDVLDVRTALESAGVSWGLVDLSGGRVMIRPAIDARSTDGGVDRTSRSFRAEAPVHGNADETTPAVDGDFRRVSVLLDASTADELTETIARLVFDDVQWIEPDPARVLVRIDRSEMTRLPESITDCQIRLRGRGDTDVVLAEVSGRLSDGRRPQVLIPIDVRLEREVPVASRRLARGRRLLGIGVDLEVDRRLLRVSEVVGEHATVLAVTSVVRRELATTVDAGQPVLRSMLVPEIVVRSGMRVRVRSVSGGYEMIREMEALDDGAVGDRIPCGEICGARGGRRTAGNAAGQSDQIMAVVIDDRGTLEIQ
jgi:flagella basal body P-ring formation protein FlgA